MEPPAEVLEDIDLRFIRTAPKETLQSVTQIMFLVEHAYWYYEDHVREKYPNLRHYAKWQDFARLMFLRGSPLLKQYADKFDEHLDNFRRFKRLIPVYGAILMDEACTRVLLVRGLLRSSGWGFPKGKVNAGEDGMECAAREVLEETGVNIEPYVKRDDFISVTADGKPHTLYIVVGIDPDTTVCAPKTKGEIGAYGWHYIKDLPATIDEANQVYLSSTGDKLRFFMVQPFVRPLREWIRNYHRRQGGKGGKGGKGGATPKPSLPPSTHASMAGVNLNALLAGTAATPPPSSNVTIASAAVAASAAMSGLPFGQGTPAAGAGPPAALARGMPAAPAAPATPLIGLGPAAAAGSGGIASRSTSFVGQLGQLSQVSDLSGMRGAQGLSARGGFMGRQAMLSFQFDRDAIMACMPAVPA